MVHGVSRLFKAASKFGNFNLLGRQRPELPCVSGEQSAPGRAVEQQYPQGSSSSEPLFLRSAPMATSAVAEPSVRALRAEAEVNRARLTGTVEELRTQVADTATDLKERLSPSAIKAEVTGYVREISRSALAQTRTKGAGQSAPGGRGWRGHRISGVPAASRHACAVALGWRGTPVIQDNCQSNRCHIESYGRGRGPRQGAMDSAGNAL